MRIGVPKEIKAHEYRVGLTPESASELIREGHDVLVERNAGAGIDIADAAYEAVGASIADTAGEVFGSCDLIVKVKEPQLSECELLRQGQTLFTYLHLAADKPQAVALCSSGCWAIAYETVTDTAGRLPLLRPMSEVAGRMSIQVAADALQKNRGGRALLLGGVPGVPAAKVVILGAGVAGAAAAQIAIGMRADVTIFDKSTARLAEIDALYGERLNTAFATRSATEAAIYDADVVIGAVLVPGASAPKLIKRDMLAQMKSGAVIVDISIDQGGCFETSTPTTHDDPTFIVDGVVHYCVANMPGAVARTSTYALNNATLPFALQLANSGLRDALQGNVHLRNGLNVADGHIAHATVAADLGMPYVPPAALAGP